jgi:magnesium chelatase subunit D
VRLGQNARNAKDIGEVMISDGKSNVSLSRSLASSSSEEPEHLGLDGIRQELLTMAGAIRQLGMELLVIDTGNRFAADLARHAGCSAARAQQAEWRARRAAV